MEEVVGQCMRCEKTVYCLDGFLNGVSTDDHKLYCFSCAEEKQE